MMTLVKFNVAAVGERWVASGKSAAQTHAVTANAKPTTHGGRMVKTAANVQLLLLLLLLVLVCGNDSTIV